MRRRLLCDARFQLEIEIKGPVLIKAGDSGITGPDMAFVRTQAYGDGEAHPYLPGTSLKGVFRSHLERIARTLKPNTTPVCLPYQFERGPEQSCGKRFDKSTPRPRVYREECLACRMFGSLEFKGRVFIDDAYAVNPRDLGIEVRNGVAIDRKTGGSAGSALYDLEVITRGTFRTTVTLENFELWQLGALGLVLRDLTDERLRFGLGTSRGLGHVVGRIVSAEIRYPMTHESSLDGIETIATEGEQKSYGLFAGKSRPTVPLPQPTTSSIWNVHQLEGPALDAVLDASRDELNAFMQSYRWNGGPQ